MASGRSSADVVTRIFDQLTSVYVKSDEIVDSAKENAGLSAMVLSQSRTTKGGIVLSYYLEALPVEVQAWHADTVKVLRRDGCCYGCATGCMRGLHCPANAFFRQLAVVQFDETFPFAWTVDEDVRYQGCRAFTPRM
ncbi:hypothetical protein CUR178_06532 [Leishmania enriettii]|uniref:Uncharacterized protein n=1 Tax=Leishmania enriettii TaxID=5663 RepID=A0A836HJB0_LEIEN|nr:hypothetical protein CUR178_06532 [Leishmania enriettii]